MTVNESDSMDTDAPKGSVSTPCTQTPAPRIQNPTPFRPAASTSLRALLAPERDRAVAQSPTKYTAIRKRPHAQTASPETTEGSAPPTALQNAPPSCPTSEFNQGVPEGEA